MSVKKIVSVYFIFLFLFPSVFGEEKRYTVKKGDNLYRISKSFNVPVDILLKSNNIKDPRSLRIGMKLIIPGTYQVKKGDTLYSIARRYNVTVREIMQANGILNSSTLKINQRLYIPSETSPPSVKKRDDQNNITGNVLWPHPGLREPYEGKMKGTLIVGKKGDLVFSVSSGRVIWSNPYRGFGNVILIYSKDGHTFGYLGNEEMMVKVGEKVETGTPIGRLGVYLHQSQAKLLFIVYNNKKKIYLDPAEILRSK